jgi:hypothetical protein
VESNRKNSKLSIAVALIAAIALLERAVRGVFFEEASSLTRGTSAPQQFIGEPAVLVGLAYCGLSLVLIGYLLRFNRWRALLYAGLFLAWVVFSATVLWL